MRSRIERGSSNSRRRRNLPSPSQLDDKGSFSLLSEQVDPMSVLLCQLTMQGSLKGGEEEDQHQVEGDR